MYNGSRKKRKEDRHVLAFLKHPDPWALLESFTEWLTHLAESLSVATWIPFAVVLVLAVILGQAGYRLIKLVTALSLGVVGYFLGEPLYALLCTRVPEAPEWLIYAFGGAVAILFFALAFAKFSYAWYGIAALFGYVLLQQLLPSGYKLLSAGGALLFAFLGVCLVRAVFILVTSLLASGVAVTCLGAIFPQQSVLQLGEHWGACAILLGLALLFAVIQFATNRKKKE